MEQLSLENLFSNLLYSLGAFSIFFIVLGLGFIDAGNVRGKNLLDTWIVKVIGGLIAAFGTVAVGYSLWQWSFYEAFAIPNPLGQAISDWWLGGPYLSTFAQHLDPAAVPHADTQQIFAVFFAAFSMATVALIHGGVLERVKPAAFFVMAAVIGFVLSPLASYLTWGPVGPLTSLGMHDFEGVFPLYIFAGTWVLVMNWRLKPRLGAFAPHASGLTPKQPNASLIAVGVILIMFALPFVALGATWVIPGEGVYGISFTETSWGLITINVLVAFCGGAMSGAVIAYWKKKATFAFLGPIAGVVITGTLLDVGTPIEVFLLSLAGPVVAYLTALLVRKLGIDDQKVIPLALGPGIIGAIATGFIAWGTPTGGYPGLEGQYAFQGAEITPLWQLAGVGVTVALAAIPCLLLCVIFERFGGLRASEKDEFTGYDRARWGVDNYEDEKLPPLPSTGKESGKQGR